MLEQTAEALTKTRVILASKSPGRRGLIEKLGINPEVVPSLYDENLDRSTYKSHGEYIQDLAMYKVQEVYDRMKKTLAPPFLIIGADTMVTMGDIIYGKPKNELDAFKMLSSLANKEHTVITGICLKTSSTEVKFYESTKVKFGDLSEEQIRIYIKSGECFEKAGAYGIQGLASCLIEKINGDFYTVMGMPLYSLTQHLNKIFSRT